MPIWKFLVLKEGDSGVILSRYRCAEIYSAMGSSCRDEDSILEMNDRFLGRGGSFGNHLLGDVRTRGNGLFQARLSRFMREFGVPRLESDIR